MVRPPVDDRVDRLEVYVPRGIQLTSTNRSRAYPKFLNHTQSLLHPVSMSRDDGGKVTPVPIPNTEVKLSSADGTWTAGSWESRTSRGNREKSDPAMGRAFFVLLRDTNCNDDRKTKCNGVCVSWESREQAFVQVCFSAEIERISAAW